MKNKAFLFCLFILISGKTFPQQNTDQATILFYNVENLFDIKNNHETNDDEFTPKGDRRWTYKRFNKKIQNISKVILSSSGWKPPEIVALCEIENRFVLERLISETPLKSFSYKIIHKESPDFRGIDVALLYNEDEFYPLEYKYIPIRLENDSVLNSREILYVSGIIKKTDTLHLFANHWPSRYSGLLESQSLRNRAANILRSEIEFVQKKHGNPNIVIVGDFNDQPSDESISLHLGVEEFSENNLNYNKNQMYNLSFSWMNKEPGTLKYQSQWSVFDQIMVSGNLLKTGNTLFTRAEWAKIVQLPFLLENDERYGGIKPNRTYIGFRYNGGFSDHLPVLLKLQINR
ncbi:MAG: endonuclease [Mariniphaga sp.]|nr:endonuclease [Mariniphaga sp.]